MAAYTWSNIFQGIVVCFWFAGLLLLTISGPKLNYCSYEDDTEKLLTDDAARTACEAEAAAGDTDCVKDFYKNRGWKTYAWFVLYFTLTWLILETFFMALYLMLQRYGIMWFVLMFFMVLGFIWLTIVIVTTTVYWVDCEKYQFCANAKFVFDFTDEVKQKTAWAWIVHNTAFYLLWLAHIFFFIASIINQALLSRAVAESTGFERADFLNPLFGKEDRRRIREANAQEVGGSLDGAPRQAPESAPINPVIAQFALKDD